jgi:hypothetical protein
MKDHFFKVEIVVGNVSNLGRFSTKGLQVWVILLSVM